MSNIPTIWDVDELLILLKESPPMRAVAYVGDLCRMRLRQRRPHSPDRSVDDTGPAGELLNKAYDADIAGDATWVLSAHPKAPTNPGSD